MLGGVAGAQLKAAPYAVQHYLFGELGELNVGPERMDLISDWQTDVESVVV